MNPKLLSEFESHIHHHFLSILKMSPIESMTPFEMVDATTGKSEFIFIAKCSPYLYAPVKKRSIDKKTKLDCTLYNEGNDMIIRFEFLTMMLESSIPADGARAFLSVLLEQESITLVVVDADSYKVIWLTNTISLKDIPPHSKEIFKRYNLL